MVRTDSQQAPNEAAPARGAGRRSLLTLITLAMTSACAALATVVTLHPPENSGGYIYVPVIIEGQGEPSVSGLAFDLHYDSASYEFVEAVPAAAATDAGKGVAHADLAPGTSRVLMTGFNNEAVYDGHLATIVLRPLTTDPAAHSLSVDRVLASDPFGNPVQVGYEDLYGFPPASPTEHQLLHAGMGFETQTLSDPPDEATDPPAPDVARSPDADTTPGPAATSSDSVSTESATTPATRHVAQLNAGAVPGELRTEDARIVASRGPGAQRPAAPSASPQGEFPSSVPVRTALPTESSSTAPSSRTAAGAGERPTRPLAARPRQEATAPGEVPEHVELAQFSPMSQPKEPRLALALAPQAVRTQEDTALPRLAAALAMAAALLLLIFNVRHWFLVTRRPLRRRS